jgi:predicted transcriptional regulator
MSKRLKGRLCYGHLGGELGGRLLDLLKEKGWIALAEGRSSVYVLTPEGRDRLSALGMNLEVIEL